MNSIALVGNGPVVRRAASVLAQLRLDSALLSPVSPGASGGAIEQVEAAAQSGDHDVVVYDATSVSPAERDTERLLELVETWDLPAALVVLSDFGRSSDLHDWSVDHIGLQAAGLWMAVTGQPDRPPLPTQSTIMDSLVAYALTSAILSARIGRDRGSATTPVWVSRLEVALSCQPYFDLRNRYTGRDTACSGMPFPMMLCPARTGFLGVNVLTDDQWYLLCSLADRGDLLGDDRFGAPDLRLSQGSVLTDEFRTWALTVDAKPTFHHAQAMRVPLGYLPETAELLDQLRQLRDAVEPDADPSGVLPIGFDRAAGALADSPHSQNEPADAAWSDFDAAAPGIGPLRGTRVLDLTMFWAGPLASLYFAAYGATVVKIESPTRLDGWRGLAGTDSIESSHLFNGVNVNKFDISLNLKDDDSRAAIERLVRGADVLVDNYSPGVLDRFGLGDDRLRELNPTMIHLSMPAFGSSGPWRDYVGFAPTIEQLSGLPHLTRYAASDEPRLLGNSVADPAGGWGGITAVLSELVGRSDDVGFVRLDLSQHRSLQGMLVPDLSAIGADFEPEAVLIRCSAGGHGTHPADPTDGIPQWVVVSASGSDPATVLGEFTKWLSATPGWVDDRHGESGQVRFVGTKWDAAAELQRAGFTAMPVLSAADVVASGARLGRNDYLAELDKDAVGRAAYSGLPLDFVGADRGMRWPGPTVGEHDHLLMSPDEC